MAFRFVHIADVHLDTPFQNREKGVRAFLREAVRQAFKAACDLALGERTDALLIAGDLFDNDTLSFATEKFLLGQMHRLQEAGIGVYYAPGNHDPFGAGYRANQITWPANVHVFSSGAPFTRPVWDSAGQIRAVVCGAGHAGPGESKNLARAFPVAERGVPYVGLLHTLVSGAGGEALHGKYAPCILADLAEKGYAYWALGHVHTRAELLSSPLAVYPGNLVGRNPGEDGPRGAYLVEAEGLGKVKASFHALAPVYWATCRVDSLEEAANLESLEQKIYASSTKQLEGLSFDGRLFLRVILSGPCPLYMELQSEENLAVLREDLERLLHLEYLEVITDGVVRPVDPERYKNEPHVLSTFLHLWEELSANDELLLRLAPEPLAGCPKSSPQETLSYLRSLLAGLDLEACARLAEGEQK